MGQSKEAVNRMYYNVISVAFGNDDGDFVVLDALRITGLLAKQHIGLQMISTVRESYWGTHRSGKPSSL